MAKNNSSKLKILRREKTKKLLAKVDIKTAYDIILYGLKTQKSSRLIESTNTLTFICNQVSTKPEIKQAFKLIYGVDSINVNTLNTFDGRKKAYIRCKEDGDAMEVATKFNII